MTHGIGRREFLQSVAVIAAATRAGAQTPAANEWGSQVLDIHLHPRATVEGSLLHLDGAGVTKAVLLTGAAAEERAKQSVAAHPSRFVRFASIDMTQPDAIDRLRAAAKGGAIGFGEIKSQVAAAGPEMQRLYALAAELNLPITIHFQEVNQPNSPGTFNTGLKQFDAMLEEVSEDDVHRTRRRVLGKRERRLRRGHVVSEGAHQAWRRDRQVPWRLPQSVRRHVGELGQQFPQPRSRICRGVSRAASEQADVRQRLFVRRRTRHVRPRRLGGPLHRARHADDAEEARAAGRVQERLCGKTGRGC